MTVRDPEWGILEERAWEKYVRSMPRSREEKREKYLEQIGDARQANKDLSEEGITSVEVIVGATDNFHIRPARPFYEKYPSCKFSYGEHEQSKNDFSTAEEAKDAVYSLRIPDIRQIHRGWGIYQPDHIVRRCNEQWRDMVEGEVQRSVKEILTRERSAV